MLGLYLIAAHMFGDFVLQDRWTAARKLGQRHVRFNHVIIYSLPFIPIAWIYAPGWRGSVFVLALPALHYLTDSRRFHSTLGDWLGWRHATPKRRAAEWALNHGPVPVGTTSDSLPPNPWEPTTLLVDQALHVAQLSILGGLLLA